MKNTFSETIAGTPPRSRGGFLNPNNSRLPLPSHHTYVETRGSNGAWLFHKIPSPLEVLNDLDGQALNLSRVLIDPVSRAVLAAEYALALGQAHTADRATPHTEQILRATGFAATIERATAKLPRQRKPGQRRGILHLDAGLDWVDRVFDRLRNVQIENGTTAKLIERFDWSQTLFLCDERGTDWDGEQAQEMIAALNGAVGKIILITTGMPSSVEGDNRWHRPADGEINGESIPEIVWRNF
ncbi:MAG: hypothetical protein SGI92_05555 [Bryobacteraceae bacterium]|nr:hypothetical protein [Bryobacteraceae bacterium]